MGALRRLCRGPLAGALMKVLTLDTEIYKDYFLVMFRDVDTGETYAFDSYPGKTLDTRGIARHLKERLVTFNGNHFDMPLIALALAGANNERIKAGCDAIIGSNLKSWQFERQFNVKVPKLDHIDLIEVAPGIASLKIYGGRLHAPKIQDLPILPSASISPEQRPVLIEYCGNDLLTTERLYKHLLPQIELRERMSNQYSIDLRSKSDAQVAEAVIIQEAGRKLGREIERPTVPPGTTFRYTRPDFITFSSPTMQAVGEMIDGVEFVVSDKGGISLPKDLSEFDIKIGAAVYRLGIGGLHSTEKSVAHKADADTLLIDRDVASYYPAIILALDLAPPHMGRAFIETFQDILDRRLEAKRTGDKVAADSLKITVNGSFGKFGSKWSKLYAPNLLIQTTITGQLALLMLIDSLEAFGIQVVSANTDGVVMKCPVNDVHLMDMVVEEWEEKTGFTTEATEYSALYSRDVNNYIAIKADGLAKLKGVYAPVSLQKNPTNEISTEAVVKFLKDGTPIEYTINHCKDIRKFVTVRQVKGGAVLHGEYLGKAVRWYYSIAGIGPIQYKVNGYMVPRSEGAEPLMDITQGFPADIDYSWYVGEANSILKDIGAT